jgi:mycoredoxin
MAEITFFWRPGCGFCTALSRRLDSAGISYVRRNIWDDPSAAEWVRSVNRGNETVPTLDIGGIVLTNPSLEQVQAALASVAAAPSE